MNEWLIIILFDDAAIHILTEGLGELQMNIGGSSLLASFGSGVSAARRDLFDLDFEVHRHGWIELNWIDMWIENELTAKNERIGGKSTTKKDSKKRYGFVYFHGESSPWGDESSIWISNWFQKILTCLSISYHSLWTTPKTSTETHPASSHHACAPWYTGELLLLPSEAQATSLAREIWSRSLDYSIFMRLFLRSACFIVGLLFDLSSRKSYGGPVFYMNGF